MCPFSTPSPRTRHALVLLVTTLTALPLPAFAIDPPTGLTLAPGNQKVAVSWTGPVTMPSADRYTIKVLNGATTVASVDRIRGTSYVVTGLSNVISYTFKVSATDVNGNGSTYAVGTQQPQAIAPTQPVALSSQGIGSSSSKIQLSWAGPAPVGSATGWQVSHDGGGNLPVTITGPDTSNIFTCTTGVPANGTYNYTVKATASDGIGGTWVSGAATPVAVVSPASALTAPSAPTLTAGNQQVMVRWSSVSGAKSYNIYRTEGGVVSEIAQGITSTTTPITYNDYFPRNNAAYTYQVEAQNDSYAKKSLGTVATPHYSLGARPAKYNINYNVEGGAVDYNISHFTGGANTLYIEYQRFGAVYVENGVNRGDTDLIKKGLEIIHWGLDRQDATGGGFAQSKDEYHSTSLFIEAAARALVLLYTKSQIDSRYAPENIYGTDTIASYYAPRIYQAAEWLKSNTSAGTNPDPQYTHRFWLLAAGLGQAAQLEDDNLDADTPGGTGNTSDLTSAAASAATTALNKQKDATWVAAISTSMLPSGFPPAAALYTMSTEPAGSYTFLSAYGVNPETNDGTYDYFDVSYEGVGLNYAQRYYSTLNAPSTSIKNMLNAGLTFEVSRMLSSPWSLNPSNLKSDGTRLADGIVDISGSSRMGIEDNEGSTNFKTPDVGQLATAFTQTFALETGSDLSIHPEYGDFPAWAYRINHNNDNFNLPADTGGATVAISGNIPGSYSVNLQGIGADVIKTGISLQRSDIIDLGLRVLDWGLQQEVTNGPAWTGSGTSSWGATQFIESASRAVLLLQNYAPNTQCSSAGSSPAPIPYSATSWNSYYRAYLLGSYTSAYGRGYNYYSLLKAAAAAVYNNGSVPTGISGNSIKLFGTGAALIEAWRIDENNPSVGYNPSTGEDLRVQAQNYAVSAVGLQWTNGVSPVAGAISTHTNGNGQVDVTTDQTQSLAFAERYYQQEKSAYIRQRLEDTLSSGLTWEKQWINVQGDVVTQANYMPIGILPDTFQNVSTDLINAAGLLLPTDPRQMTLMGAATTFSQVSNSLDDPDRS